MGPRAAAARQAAVGLVKRSDDAEGFEVLPKRWIVERTFAGRGRWRRLRKDYEGTTSQQ